MFKYRQETEGQNDPGSAFFPRRRLQHTPQKASTKNQHVIWQRGTPENIYMMEMNSLSR